MDDNVWTLVYYKAQLASLLPTHKIPSWLTGVIERLGHDRRKDKAHNYIFLPAAVLAAGAYREWGVEYLLGP